MPLFVVNCMGLRNAVMLVRSDGIPYDALQQLTIPRKRTLFHDQWRDSIHRFAWSGGKTYPDGADVQRR